MSEFKSLADSRIRTTIFLTEATLKEVNRLSKNKGQLCLHRKCFVTYYKHSFVMPFTLHVMAIKDVHRLSKNTGKIYLLRKSFVTYYKHSFGMPFTLYVMVITGKVSIPVFQWLTKCRGYNSERKSVGKKTWPYSFNCTKCWPK